MGAAFLVSSEFSPDLQVCRTMIGRTVRHGLTLSWYFASLGSITMKARAQRCTVSLEGGEASVRRARGIWKRVVDHDDGQDLETER